MRQNLFEEIMAENVPNLVKETYKPRKQRIQNKVEPKRLEHIIEDLQSDKRKLVP